VEELRSVQQPKSGKMGPTNEPTGLRLESSPWEGRPVFLSIVRKVRKEILGRRSKRVGNWGPGLGNPKVATEKKMRPDRAAGEELEEIKKE